ncbi:DMT family transporter [Shewanella zhangzhouensis]|uniref:DMT family transporter n=1 Tax=Shewanella zhangzhouensis TaxID=2864213 RepID=UPI001C654B22|nr:DMT family transporter [Shewanella zhangzhouensis]QYK06035.1 DMT family transporter [Shewanella zhangzhouensis]
MINTPKNQSQRWNSRLWFLTALTMLAFAANSLLCREALASGSIDAASFTLVRMVSGAVVLAMLALAQGKGQALAGNWRSATALLGYAAAFSFAYHSLSTATGALVLFGAVQGSMIGYGFWAGERLGPLQVFGVVLAMVGLGWFLLPGVASPDPFGAALMLLAGCCWGAYSLLGRGVASPLAATAGNFVRAVPLALVLYGLLALSGLAEVTGQGINLSGMGVVYGIASGALASGLGYALWYSVLPRLEATTAATVQLSVPIIASFGGWLLLGEAMSLRLIVSAFAVLGGIALVVQLRR